MIMNDEKMTIISQLSTDINLTDQLKQSTLRKQSYTEHIFIDMILL